MWTVCPKCGHDKVDPEEGCIPCQFKQANLRDRAGEAKRRQRVRAERRFRTVYIEDSLLLDILLGNVKLCLDSAPIDMEFVAASYEFVRQALFVVVQSSTWDPIPPDGIIPLLEGGSTRLFQRPSYEEQVRQIKRVARRHYTDLLPAADGGVFQDALLATLKELNGETTRS
jgi:hypothetical protein